MRKEKLSIPQQVEYMEKQGIGFNIISKSDAKRFLENNTYYFKLKAYAKNYSKYSRTEKVGQYCNLEFAYLVDLSTIDANLRKLIIKITLDIEHFLKVKLLRDFVVDATEDGYEIIDELFRRNPTIKEELLKKGANSYCSELVLKYKDEFAIWNIVEVLSFGQFIELYNLYYERNARIHRKDKDDIRNELLPIKFLRNAAAHNNCLINKMCEPYSRSIIPNQAVNRIITQIPGIPKKSIQKKMKNPVIHDFVVMLYVFNLIVTSDKTKEKVYHDLHKLFNGRMIRNKEYYSGNELLASSYLFVKIVVDFFSGELTKSRT